MTTTPKTIDSEIAALRADLERPAKEEAAKRATLARLEAERAAAREAVGKDEAEKRVLGCKRGDGSHAARLDQLVEREQQLVTQLVALRREKVAITEKRALLARESEALAHRFGVTPAFPLNLHAHLHRLVVPDVVIPVQEPPRLVPSYVPKMEQCEHRLRERRSYAEVAGTDAFAIIQAAGLPPFPPLTAAQEEILAERGRPRRRDPVVAQAAAEVAALPSTVSAATAMVHRG